MAVATPMHITDPVSEGTLSVVRVSSRIHTMPARAPGSAVMMMNGSSQDWKFTTISKYTSRIAISSPMPSPINDECMVLTWPRTTIRVPRGRCPVNWLENFGRIGGHPAQVAPLGAGVHIDHRLNVVVRDYGGPRDRRNLHQIAKHLRWRSADCTAAASPVLVGTPAGAMLAFTGVFIRSCSEVMRYCGVCTAI